MPIQVTRIRGFTNPDTAIQVMRLRGTSGSQGIQVMRLRGVGAGDAGVISISASSDDQTVHSFQAVTITWTNTVSADSYTVTTDDPLYPSIPAGQISGSTTTFTLPARADKRVTTVTIHAHKAGMQDSTADTTVTVFGHAWYWGLVDGTLTPLPPTTVL